MRDLIKKILTEIVGQKLESIEYVGNISTKKLEHLLEQTNFDHIDDNIRRKINRLFIKQQEYAKNLSPLNAEFQDKKTNQIRKAKFNLIIDRHFTERNFREETFPNDPFFNNPDEFEGINVVASNIDNIWKSIFTNKYGNGTILKLKTISDKVSYEILVRLNTPTKNGKLPIYDITLFNQIKGVRKSFKREQNIVKAYNPVR